MQYILSDPRRYFVALVACGVVGAGIGAALVAAGVLPPIIIRITVGG
jgi:hypothetical protein